MSEGVKFEGEGAVALRETECFSVHSSAADADYEVRVALPIAGWRTPPDAPWHVLVVLDGDLFFGMATETTRLMHSLFGELPPILVVGVGYGTNDPTVQGETRNRDFTPSADAGFEAMGRRMMPDREPLLPEGRRFGRAAQFLEFLTGELRPFITTRYPRASASHTLFGSSMGGLFAAWTLLERPRAFDGYVVASPALWWDGGLLFRVEEERGATSQTSESSCDEARNGPTARAFFGAGALEEGAGISGVDEFRLVSNARRMAELLGGPRWPGVEASFEVFPGESHTSVVSTVLTRGVRRLLSPRRSG